METRSIIETTGSIAKVERLCSVNSKIMPNTLVLENMEPFPGYHGENLPVDAPPPFIFLATTGKLSLERVKRITQQIKKYCNIRFDATMAKVCIQNDVCYTVRIKDLESYDLIPELQGCYFDEGIQFRKSKNINDEALIQVKKHFVLEKIENGIYKDLEEPLMYYIQVPMQVKWKMLFNMTKNLKNNMEFSNFDAAPGAVYFREILDVIRIYGKELDLDKLKQLRQKYLAEIDKVQSY
jgi:hypothetical protein